MLIIDIMYSPHLLISTMQHFKCSAVEAQAFLNAPSNELFEFRDGRTHVPYLDIII